MPTVATLTAFMGAALVLIVVPGPNLIFLVTRSVADGRNAGLRCALGFETGTIVHITAAAVGLTALLASSASAFSAVKYLGAAYLLYLGVTTLQRTDAADRGEGPRRAGRDPYRDAILVQVLNPKVAIFFLAFLPQFVNPHHGAATQVIVLGVVYSALELAVNVITAASAGWAARRLNHRRGGRPWGQWASGATYLALGAMAALSPSHRTT